MAASAAQTHQREFARPLRVVRQQVALWGLDLSGLTVLTEAATGHFVYTPVIAALAGAKHVFAVTRDSRYGSAEEVTRLTRAVATEAGVWDRVTVLSQKAPDALAQADVVTNLGFVRPIDRETIGHMKPTAVIPLMYEPWELRPQDVDLEAARERGIPVLGTNEEHPRFPIMRYVGPLVVKVLMREGLEVTGCTVVVHGTGKFGRYAAESLAALGARVLVVGAKPQGWRLPVGATWVGASLREEGARREMAGADAVVLTRHEAVRQVTQRPPPEGGGPDLSGPPPSGGGPRFISEQLHGHHADVLSATGELVPEELARLAPGTVVAQLSGSSYIDRSALSAEGVRYTPLEEPGPGFMGFTLAELGPTPVIALHTAGLKVGEAAVRARMAGGDVEEAARRACAQAPGADGGW